MAFAWQPGLIRLGGEAAKVHGKTASRALPAYKEGEVLVKMKEHKASIAVEDLAREMGVENARKLKSDRAVPRLYRLKLKAGDTVEGKVLELMSHPDVESAQPNFIYRAAITPNDGYFNQQWGLNNTGQLIGGQAGLPGADIHAPAAWDITTGSQNVVVGVIDTGIDYMSPDIVGNLWINPQVNRDGFVNDYYGINVITGSGDPYDDNLHGTHVSGIIGAKGNNTEGIAGVNWNTRIMALKFLDSSGSGTTAGAVECINYAISKKSAGVNVRVLNASWGGTSSDPALETAIISAGNADILFVAAAGNSGSDNSVTPFYPASYPDPNVIAVAATDNTDKLASFSNYGYTSVAVGAPGVYVLSTVPVLNTIFFDSFDPVIGPWAFGGTNNTWAFTTTSYYSPTHSLASNPGGPYQTSTNSWAMLGPLDFSAEGGPISFRYYMDLDTMPYFDWLYIEDSKDGVNWTTVDGWSGSTGGSYYQESNDISSMAGSGKVYVRFRLQTGPWGGSYAGAYLDDVTITTKPTTISATGNYMYASGTSMAAPHVTGLAALMLSANPSLTTAQIKDIIMNNVDPLGLPLVTGGRIDAAKAVTAANNTSPPSLPNIAAVSPSSALPGAGVTITGTHFGGVAGTVYLTANGTATGIAPASWSDTSITFTVPNIGVGVYQLTVSNSIATSNAMPFTINAPPNIAAASPSSALPGASVTVNGSYFGSAAGTVNLTLNGVTTNIVPKTWADTSIIFTVPNISAGIYQLTVSNSVATSNAVQFTVNAPPNITSVSPSSARIGTRATINGSYFGSAAGTVILTVNGKNTSVVPSTWTNTVITFTVPKVKIGTYMLTVRNSVATSNAIRFSVLR